MNVPARNFNLSYEQVLLAATGNAPIFKTVIEGDVITWRCNHIREDLTECPWMQVENVHETRIVDMNNDFPKELIDHIWKEGHVKVTTGNHPVPAASVAPQGITRKQLGCAFILGFLCAIVIVAVIR